MSGDQAGSEESAVAEVRGGRKLLVVCELVVIFCPRILAYEAAPIILNEVN